MSAASDLLTEVATSWLFELTGPRNQDLTHVAFVCQNGEWSVLEGTYSGMKFSRDLELEVRVDGGQATARVTNSGKCLFLATLDGTICIHKWHIRTPHSVVSMRQVSANRYRIDVRGDVFRVRHQ